MTSKLARLFAGAAALMVAGTASADRFNLQPPETIIAHEIYNLHTLIMWIILVIFVVVFGAMTYSIVKHRKAAGHKAEQFHENTTVEIIWTVIPFLILIGMTYPATKTVIQMKDTSSPDMTIKATGYQWKWGYDYLKEGISFYSNLATPREEIEGRKPKGENYLLEVDRPVVVPTGKKIRLIVTANDVIHSWWMPAFGVKQDAIPGFVRDTWFKVDKPGTYRGQCAELCGKDHGFMPIVVEAVEPEKYAEWVAGQKKKMEATATAEAPGKTWTLDELKAQGEKVYTANCVACHQANGMGVPGAFPPLAGGHPFTASPQMLKDLEERGFYKDGKTVMGPVKNHIDIVLHGISGTAMASWKQLSDVEIAAVITYERNSWSNKTGDMVTPADVKASRK